MCENNFAFDVLDSWAAHLFWGDHSAATSFFFAPKAPLEGIKKNPHKVAKLTTMLAHRQTLVFSSQKPKSGG